MYNKHGLGDMWGSDAAKLQASMNAGDRSTMLYCNSILGQVLSPTGCHIPSQAEIRAQQVADLARISAINPQAAAAALSRSDAVIASDQAARPWDYAAQESASSSPVWSAAFGPENVAAITQLTTSPFLPVALMAGAGLILVLILRK